MKPISSVDVMGGGYTLGGLVGRVGFLIRKTVRNWTLFILETEHCSF